MSDPAQAANSAQATDPSGRPDPGESVRGYRYLLAGRATGLGALLATVAWLVLLQAYGNELRRIERDLRDGAQARVAAGLPCAW